MRIFLKIKILTEIVAEWWVLVPFHVNFLQWTLTAFKPGGKLSKIFKSPDLVGDERLSGK